TVRKLVHSLFTASDAPVQAQLALDRGKHPPTLIGNVTLFGGLLRARDTAVSLRPSTVVFDGNPLKPRFNLAGTSRIGQTTIHVTLAGTREEPKLKLSSSPPQPEGILLAMLATGREWKGAQEAVQGEVSSDLAVDFLDYLFFGGAGE